MQPSSGQDLNAVHGQMSDVLKPTYSRNVRRFKEFHDEMSLPAFDANYQFPDPPCHGGVSDFEFALHPVAREPDAA